MQKLKNLPAKLNRLDNEAQRRTNIMDILVHDLLYYCSFPCIVETSITAPVNSCAKRDGRGGGGGVV